MNRTLSDSINVSTFQPRMSGNSEAVDVPSSGQLAHSAARRVGQWHCIFYRYINVGEWDFGTSIMTIRGAYVVPKACVDRISSINVQKITKYLK